MPDPKKLVNSVDSSGFLALLSFSKLQLRWTFLQLLCGRASYQRSLFRLLCLTVVRSQLLIHAIASSYLTNPDRNINLSLLISYTVQALPAN